MSKFGIKLLFLIKLLLFAPIIVVVIVTNYLANLSVQNKAEIEEKKLASLLLKNNEEAIPMDSINPIRVIRFYINGLSSNKNIIFLGSSRSEQIKSSDLSIKSGASFFNGSVLGVSLEEMMAIYGMFRIKKMIPQTIILELSPWILTKKYTRRLHNVKNEYLYMLKNCLEIDSYTAKTYVDEKIKADDFLRKEEFEKFFSLKFFQICLQKQLHLPPWGRGRNAFFSDINDFLCMINALTTNLIVEFAAFIKLLQKDQVRIIFFLAPFHQDFYEKIITKPEYEIVLKIQEYFINFAKQNNIEIVGSYNPITCNCYITDFRDPIHPINSTTKKILKNIHF
ncbi:MAG: hypothetical protein V1646_03520 [bacterium]